MTLQYVARKHMRVAGRTVVPGEIVPEATTWRNVQAYIDNGSLAVALPIGPDAEALAGIEARVAALEARLNGVPASEGEGNTDLLNGFDTNPAADTASSGGNDTPDVGSSAADTGNATDGEDGPPPDSLGEPIDLDALEGITRAALDAQAIALGIEDAPKLANKLAVATAINEAAHRP